MSKKYIWPIVMVIYAAVFSSNLFAGKMPPPMEQCKSEPIKYIGSAETDKRFWDGRLRHAVGVHRYQAFHSNRSHPSEGGEFGWTYNHQPFICYWNDQFYVQYLSDPYEEHSPPGRTLIMTSKDGRIWSNPVVVFPEYTLPEIKKNELHKNYIPAGTKSVMHQRMGFYAAPNGRLLTLAFYSYTAHPRTSPNAGTGVGRVVREVYNDGNFGPIYFIRYNRHAGWNESNTNYPFYKESKDKGFLEACEGILNDKLMNLQWWEEDRAKDGFYNLDPGDVKSAFQFHANMTTFEGAGKAFNFYRRPDGVIVGIWKNQWSAMSPDNGKTWTGISKNTTFMTCGAKIWGQQTEDGNYAIIYNSSATRGNRYPMTIMTSEDGYFFDNLLCLEGEVPPMKYQGIHKGLGSQYIRGIMPGNGNPPGNHIWNTFSVNKEDIWVARTHVPVTAIVYDHVAEDFEKAKTEADLELWNLYVPTWAPISIVKDPVDSSNQCLELRDEEPYNYALAERAFPPNSKLTLEFRIYAEKIPQGRGFEIELQDQYGNRPMKLRFDRNWMYMDKGLISVNPAAFTQGKWYSVRLELDCGTQKYGVFLNGKTVYEEVSFDEMVNNVERIVFRTGPYRGLVDSQIVDNEPRPSGLFREDAAGAGEKVEATIVMIDDVKTKN
ncbi:MAG: exo-alpha-sialidase [Candidatus Brocadiia bacterium]|nr:MAG: exo-alpha-sialidase [Candidatus Brocadiia bacterium]